jgi:hypothetical protein
MQLGVRRGLTTPLPSRPAADDATVRAERAEEPPALERGPGGGCGVWSRQLPLPTAVAEAKPEASGSQVRGGVSAHKVSKT